MYMLVWPARPSPPLLFTVLSFDVEGELSIINRRGGEGLAGQTNVLCTK